MAKEDSREVLRKKVKRFSEIQLEETQQAITKQMEPFVKLQAETQQAIAKQMEPIIKSRKALSEFILTLPEAIINRQIEPLVKHMEELTKTYERYAVSIRQGQEITTISAQKEDIIEKLLALINFLKKELIKEKEKNKELLEKLRKMKGEVENEHDQLSYIR